MDDLAGEFYAETLLRLHRVLSPATYLEIGVKDGHSLVLSECATIGVDPVIDIPPDRLSRLSKLPAIHLYRMTSDDFFARHDPTQVFGAPVDLAFLDGMHRCEFLLRDFINAERCAAKNGVVLLHDCLPVETGITTRDPATRWCEASHRQNWWVGDVWRTALLLRERRPDLRVTTLDARPSGLMVITGLDPANRALSDDYQSCVDKMLSWDLGEIGVEEYFTRMNPIPTTRIADERLRDMLN